MLNIDELVEIARRDVLKDNIGTTEEEYLWKTDTLLNYANEAIREACSRAPLLRRVSTVSVLADTSTYDINTTIRQIYVAKLDSSSEPLQQTTEAELMIKRGSRWRDNKGTPTHYIRRAYQITLYPVPVDTDTLVISSSNNYDPTVDFDFDFVTDIPDQYHQDLLHWIGHKAFRMPDDPELTNLKLSEDYLAKFEKTFGIRHTAKYEQFDRETPMYATMKSFRRR